MSAWFACHGGLVSLGIHGVEEGSVLEIDAAEKNSATGCLCAWPGLTLYGADPGISLLKQLYQYTLRMHGLYAEFATRPVPLFQMSQLPGFPMPGMGCDTKFTSRAFFLYIRLGDTCSLLLLIFFYPLKILQI